MGETWWTLVKLIVALPLVVICAVLVLRYGAKNYGGNLSAGRTMEVVDRLPLHSRASLYVVRIQKKYYLLGQHEGNVALLDKLPDYQVVKEKGGTFYLFEEMLERKKSQLTEKVAGKLLKRRGIGEDD